MSTMLLPAPPPAAPSRRGEFKAVALLPRTVTETPTADGGPTWSGIVALTGVPVGGATIAPGALTRALAKRAPKGTHGRSWTRPVAALMSAVELPPHDPRLPARLRNSPWPPAAGALQATLRFITGTADGRAALAAARRAGPAEWKLGFQALNETKAGGQRVITELDVFQLWPRSLPDGDPAGPEVKAAGVRLRSRRAPGSGRRRPRATGPGFRSWCRARSAIARPRRWSAAGCAAATPGGRPSG